MLTILIQRPSMPTPSAKLFKTWGIFLGVLALGFGCADMSEGPYTQDHKSLKGDSDQRNQLFGRPAVRPTYVDTNFGLSTKLGQTILKWSQLWEEDRVDFVGSLIARQNRDL